jgi:beta-1,4-mannosyltransferase
MKILVFPKDPNPYQELLYSEMREDHKDTKITYLTGPTSYQTINLFLLPILLIYYRFCGYKIFHIHWFYAFRIPIFNFRIFKIIMKYYCIFILYFIKILSYKLVWTNHETISHTAINKDDISISRYISRFTSNIANAKIVHSEIVINEMQENGLNTNKTFIIPHGSYMNVYPDNITRDQARKKLGIQSDETMILFFGMIRPYKGIDDLIEAYSRLSKKNVKLVIAGKCVDSKLNKKIFKFQKSIKFDFYNGHVPDEDVAKYFKASDIVCLPFKEITTSGSVLLALSFAKPIVAPRIGDLIYLPSDIGFLYDPTTNDSLFNSLSEAVSSKHLDSISRSANRYAKTLSWDKIAEKTYEVYEAVLGL